MNTTFGNVYLATGAEKSKLMENVYYCNLRQKLVDSDGNVSPLHEPYVGRPFSVSFKISQQDKTGSQVELQGMIKLLYNLGEVAQDFEGCPTAHQEMIEWLTSLEILSKDDHRIHQALQGSSMAAAFCPGAKLSEMRCLRKWIDSISILDDYMDRASSQEGLSYNSLQKYWTTLTEILEGKTVADENTLKKELNLPKPYLNFVSAMLDLRKEIERKENCAKELILAFEDCHNSLILEECREWKTKEEITKSFMYRPTQAELRLTTIGVNLMLELIYFDQGLQLPKSLRGSFLYKAFVRAISQHMSLVNDLISLKKEMAAGTSCNTINLYHMKDGLSLKDAFEKAVNQINSLTEVLNETGELLVNLFPEFEETKKVVAVVKGAAHGNVQWHTMTYRYHKDVVYDCVIEMA